MTEELAELRLSQQDPARRRELIARYEREVYSPAFPDESIREDPAYWRDLLDSDPYPPPPQPLIEVILLADVSHAILGGVTIEYYRNAGCGLLTYLSVAPDRRGQGLGRRLVAAARTALSAMGGNQAPVFAETERLQDADNDEERRETVLRQQRLAGLGARWVEFDYVMPALRPGSEPHRLHLMLIDPEGLHATVPAKQVAGLIRELAAALGAELEANADTSAMMKLLDKGGALTIVSLPAGDRP